MRTYLLIVGLVALFAPVTAAANDLVLVSFSGEVGCYPLPTGCTVLDDPQEILGGTVTEGTALHGYFILPDPLTLNNPGDESLVQMDISLPFFVQIANHSWTSDNFSFKIQDDDPFNGFDLYEVVVQATGTREASVGGAFTSGLQLFDRNRVEPISLDPSDPPDPLSFLNANRLQIFGDLPPSGGSADYLITGQLFSLSAEPLLGVDIDIKPGDGPNCLNINGNGTIPVAVLGSLEFDVSNVDIDSLDFDGLAVRARRNGRPQCSFEFSNSDSFLDLVCHFTDDSTAWTGGVGTASLMGKLLDGAPFRGSESICIVP